MEALKTKTRNEIGIEKELAIIKTILRVMIEGKGCVVRKSQLRFPFLREDNWEKYDKDVKENYAAERRYAHEIYVKWRRYQMMVIHEWRDRTFVANKMGSKASFKFMKDKFIFVDPVVRVSFPDGEPCYNFDANPLMFRGEMFCMILPGKVNE